MSNEKQREPRCKDCYFLSCPCAGPGVCECSCHSEAAAPAQPVKLRDMKCLVKKELCSRVAVTDARICQCKNCQLFLALGGVASAAAPSPVLTPNCKHEHAEMFWDGLHCSACNARYYDGRWKEAPVLTPAKLEGAPRGLESSADAIDTFDEAVLTPEFNPQTVSGMGYTDDQVSKLKELVENKSQAVLTQPSARELADKKLSIAYEEEGRWRIEYTMPDGAIISFNNRMVAEQARVQVRGMLGAFRTDAERPILPVPPSERYRFETWAEDHGLDVEREEETGDYVSRETSVAWSAWQACASSPVTLGQNSTSVHDLKAEWMAQDKILDYTNWLQSELLKARASAPAVTPGSIEAVRRFAAEHGRPSQSEINEKLSASSGEIGAAPAVAGRTQGDAEKFFYGESGEPWMYDDSYGPMWRSDMNKAVFQFATEYAALRESAREAPSKQKQQFIELVRGIMEYGIPEADAKAALLYLTHEGILKLNQDWTVEVSPEAPAAPKEK